MLDGGVWFGLLCLAGAAGLMAVSRYRLQKTMNRIAGMLQVAREGRFAEHEFSESRLSALETQFAHYLSAAAVSAQNVAQEKERIKTLVADISHQTKTPIANLLLYSELLGEEALPVSARDKVEAVHTQAEKLRFLIDALVKLSRLENGIITLSPRLEPLGPLLQSAVGQFASQAAAKGLDLQAEPTQATACFDRKWTAEALGNLVDNAIKYTAEGGVTLSVVEYEMFVCIRVRDTGMGIPEGEQAKVFSRFYRSERARDSEGVGIGLYLAREILAGEGGYVKVASQVGQGSVFSLFLPRSGEIFPNC